MKQLKDMTLEQIYLEWVNDWLSLDRMAEHYQVSKETITDLLYIAGRLYDRWKAGERAKAGTGRKEPEAPEGEPPT